MESTPTRSALLGAREERQVMGEGFRFLDEKRLLLAAEMTRQFALYRQARDRWLQQHQEAVATLQQALLRHGLQGVQLQSVPVDQGALLQQEVRHFFGVVLLDKLTLERGKAEALQEARLALSPESILCREAFAQLLTLSTELAALSGNVQRLLAEYKRTERRARALEDVLLPELDERVHDMEIRLEEMDQEEAVRVRLGHHG